MLKVRKLDYRPWPVTVTLQECIEATGEVKEVSNTFIAHFKPFTEQDLKAAREEAVAAHPAPAGVEEDQLPLALMLQRNATFFALLVRGWGKEVVDEAGQPIPYSAEMLASLVTGPDGIPISAGLNAAIFQIQYGLAPQKNSGTSPSPGPSAGEGEAPTSSPTT